MGVTKEQMDLLRKVQDYQINQLELKKREQALKENALFNDGDIQLDTPSQSATSGQRIVQPPPPQPKTLQEAMGWGPEMMNQFKVLKSPDTGKPYRDIDLRSVPSGGGVITIPSGTLGNDTNHPQYHWVSPSGAMGVDTIPVRPPEQPQSEWGPRAAPVQPQAGRGAGVVSAAGQVPNQQAAAKQGAAKQGAAKQVDQKGGSWGRDPQGQTLGDALGDIVEKMAPVGRGIKNAEKSFREWALENRPNQVGKKEERSREPEESEGFIKGLIDSISKIFDKGGPETEEEAAIVEQAAEATGDPELKKAVQGLRQEPTVSQTPAQLNPTRPQMPWPQGGGVPQIPQGQAIQMPGGSIGAPPSMSLADIAAYINWLTQNGLNVDMPDQDFYRNYVGGR